MKGIQNLETSHILNAITDIENTVCSTLGPGGTCVIINRGGHPLITKDGVSIAKDIASNNPITDAIFKMIAEAAGSVSSKVGDGTTSATVIACAFIRNYLMSKEMKWPMPYNTRMQFETMISKEIDGIESQKFKKTKPEDLMKVALVSSNNDEDIAKLSYDAVTAVGPDGVVFVDYSKDDDSRVLVYEGYRLKKSIVDPRFAMNTAGLILINPIVLVGTKIIDNINQIQKAATIAVEEQRPLVIITNAISDDVIGILLSNLHKNVINVAVIGLPGTGRTIKDFAGDIATYCGITAIMEGDSIGYDQVSPINNVKKIIVNPKFTTILPKSLNDETKVRAETLIETAKTLTGADKDEYTQRANTLLGNVAEIQIGGSTYNERSEKYDRLDDTVHALQSAVKSGIVLGQGLTYINGFKTAKIKSINPNKNMIDIFEKTINKIHDILTENGSTELVKVDEDILDPAEAVTSALRAGMSAALNILSAKTIITEQKE